MTRPIDPDDLGPILRSTLAHDLACSHHRVSHSCSCGRDLICEAVESLTDALAAATERAEVAERLLRALRLSAFDKGQWEIVERWIADVDPAAADLLGRLSRDHEEPTP